MEKLWQKIIDKNTFAHLDIKDNVWLDEIDVCDVM